MGTLARLASSGTPSEFLISSLRSLVDLGSSTNMARQAVNARTVLYL